MKQKTNTHPLIRVLAFVFSFIIISGLLYTMYQDHELEKARLLDRQRREFFKKRQYKNAIEKALQVLDIKEKFLDNNHVNLVNPLNNLADIYEAAGQYQKAEPLYCRALKIREKNFPSDHPKLASSMNNLAGIYTSMGKYNKAKSLYNQALKIQGKKFGKDHLIIASTLNRLAVVYSYMGDYINAVPLYKKSLKIHEEKLGQDHPQIARNLNNLAQIYRDMGDYAKAKPLYERALAIREKVFGPDHPDVATSLNSLARLYKTLGNYDAAKPLYERALVIREKTFGPDHPDVGRSLNGLAELYRTAKDYNSAEPLFKRSLAVFEKSFGTEHPHVATLLNNLAVFYNRLGQYEKARNFYTRSMKIRKKVLGPEHPSLGMTFNNMAGFYMDIEDYIHAEQLFKKALVIFEKVLGPDHYITSMVLKRLGKLYVITRDYNKAYQYFNQGIKKDNKLIDQIMGFSSEEQKIKFLITKKSGLNAFFTLVSQYLASYPNAKKDAFNFWLKRKGLVLESQKRFQEALIYTDNTLALKTFQELAQTRAVVSKLAFSGPVNQRIKIWREKLSEAQKKKENLEAKLSRISSKFALNQKINSANCQQVANALPKNSVLIEFAGFEPYNFYSKGNETRWNPLHYLAFILHAEDEKNIQMIDLGEAEKIDQYIFRYKKRIKDLQGKEYVESARKLHDLVFKPLKKFLGDTKEVFISPDGNLNLIPFEIFLDENDQFLIENYTVNYLAAARDLLGFGFKKEKDNKILLMGDPDFDLTFNLKKSDKRKSETTTRQKLRFADMQGFYFTRLPGTKAEVYAIRDLFGKDISKLLTGKQALESVLMQADIPEILHLATHGFFLNDSYNALLDEPEELRGLHKTVLPETSYQNTEFENPLLGSGIVLAGANTALKSQSNEHYDGIVTAEKILGLQLGSTDMVVLSACETGLGEVKAGEGVFGLRRAFTQAGAKSLVMSMWSVPDHETKELMLEFYKNIVSKKLNKCQSLRKAALKQMQVVKQRYGNADPMFWGAFVFMGEP